MNKAEKINSKFIEIMNSCGFDITMETLDVPIDYDSLQFVSTMVEIENAFNIQIPDDYLLAEGLDTSQDFLDMVLTLLNN